LTLTLESAGRIGVIADTHDDLVDWSELHDGVAAAFAAIDAIVHCGDLSTMAVLDQLDRIAPTRAVRSPGDPAADPPRLVDGPVVFQAGSWRLAAVFSLDDDSRAQVLTLRPDVVLFGGTHASDSYQRDGILFLNPGSPSLAETRSVAVLDLSGSRPAGQVIPL
jgi:putative phosphoesterase